MKKTVFTMKWYSLVAKMKKYTFTKKKSLVGLAPSLEGNLSTKIFLN